MLDFEPKVLPRKNAYAVIHNELCVSYLKCRKKSGPKGVSSLAFRVQVPAKGPSIPKCLFPGGAMGHYGEPATAHVDKIAFSSLEDELRFLTALNSR